MSVQMKLQDIYRFAIQLAKEMYEKLADAGVGTVVLMHIPEAHLEEGRKNHLNVVVSGHMASDPLDMKPLAYRSEERGSEIAPCSGFIRARRSE